jgi:hypothetical protein
MASSGTRPFRLRSLLYVGILGGPVAAATIAWVNAGRLGVERRAQRLIVVLGALAALIAATGAAALTGDTLWAFGDAPPEQVRYARLLPRVVGALLALGFHQLLRPADRTYALRREEHQAYASLWGPGLVACVFAFGVHLILVIGVGTLMNV